MGPGGQQITSVRFQVRFLCDTKGTFGPERTYEQNQPIAIGSDGSFKLELPTEGGFKLTVQGRFSADDAVSGTFRTPAEVRTSSTERPIMAVRAGDDEASPRALLQASQRMAPG